MPSFERQHNPSQTEKKHPKKQSYRRINKLEAMVQPDRPQHSIEQQYLLFFVDSRGASVLEAIPQPESQGRLRHPEETDEEFCASDSRGTDRPEVKEPPEQFDRPRHPTDEENKESKNVKNPMRPPGSLGPSSADVFLTPELGDLPWRQGVVGRGTDKGWLSYTPKDDEGYVASPSKNENGEVRQIISRSSSRANKRRTFGHPGNLLPGGKSHPVSFYPVGLLLASEGPPSGVLTHSTPITTKAKHTTCTDWASKRVCSGHRLYNYSQ